MCLCFTLFLDLFHASIGLIFSFFSLLYSPGHTVPPSSIEITAPMNGKNNLKNASHVEIQEGSSVTIECLVTGGKPAAQVRWFRKSVELRPGLS